MPESLNPVKKVTCSTGPSTITEKVMLFGLFCFKSGVKNTCNQKPFAFLTSIIEQLSFP